MATQYTVEEIGARIRSRSPDNFVDFSDTQIGERAIQRKPELKNLVKSGSTKQESNIQLEETGNQMIPLVPSGMNKEDTGVAINSVPKKSQGFVEGVNDIYERFSNAPGMKQAGQAVGGIVGGAGALIGGAVGAVANPIANIIQKKPLFQGEGKAILDTAKSTAKFGYEAGKAGVPAAATGALGKAATIPLAISQTMQGGKDVYEGVKTNNPEQTLQGGLEFGTGLFGAKTALTNKGIFVNKTLFPASQEKQITKIENTIRDVSGTPKAVTKQQMKLQTKAEQSGTAEINPQRVVAEEGLYKGWKENDTGGRLTHDTTEPIRETQKRLDTIEDQYQEALDRIDPNPKFDLLKLKNETVSKIKANSPTQEKLAREKVSNEFDAEIERNGQYVNGSTLNRFKRGLYNLGNYERMPDTGKAYRTAGESVKTSIENGYKGEFDVQTVNRAMSELLEAKRFLTTMNGSVVRGGGLSTQFARLAGTVIGSRLGIAGGILGNIVAGRLQKMSTAPSGKFGRVGDVKNMSRSEQIQNKTQSQIKTAEQNRANRKLLSPPKLAEPAPTVTPVTDTSGVLPISRELQTMTTRINRNASLIKQSKEYQKSKINAVKESRRKSIFKSAKK